MKHSKNISSKLVFTIISLTSLFSNARPEYAAQTGFVTCYQCHASPLGGAIRTEQGKQFGTRNFDMTQVSKQSWWQLDVRAQAVKANSNTASRSGVVFMSTTPSVQIPIVQDELTGEPRLSYVASYGLGMLDLGLRESMIMRSLGDLSEDQNLPKSFLIVGRFLAPFGLATDEHRTFTRIMTRTTVKDFESGFAYSGNPYSSFSYDLALTTGMASGGGALSTNDNPWAGFVNFRFKPFGQMFILGLSQSVVGSASIQSNLEASSLYFAMGTKEFLKFNGSISGEYVVAKGWNNSTVNPGMSYFIPAAATSWASEILNARSSGLALNFDYQLSDSTTLQYKTEQFVPDVEFKGDAFFRQGYGLKYRVTGYETILTRIEKSYSTRPDITELGSVMAVSDYIYILYTISI